jgi:LAS seventeen-binding protein 5
MGFFKDHQKSEITTIMDEIIHNQSLNTRRLNKVLELIDLKDDKSLYTQQNNLMELSRILRKSLKYGVSVNERILALDVMDYIIDKLDPEEIDNENFLRDKKLNDNLKLAYVGRPYAMNKIQKGKDIKLLQETTMNYINTAWSQKYPQFRSYLELYVDPASNNVIDYASDSDSTSQRKRRQPAKKKKAYLKDSADPSVLPEDLQYGIPIIDANKLSSKINTAVADAHRASSSLENRLTIINKRVYSNDDEEATEYFIKVREQRRKILRYLQLVTEGEYLGILLKCNDDMVKVLDRYDALSSLEPDEYFDSENEYNGPSYLDNQRNTGQDSYFTDDESFEDRRSVHTNSNPFEDTFRL